MPDSTLFLNLGLILSFLAVGVITLFFPVKVQRWVLRSHESAIGLAKWNPFISYVRSSRYILGLRVIGTLSTAVATLLAYAELMNLWK